MTIELLYFHGCPSYEWLLPRLEQLAASCGASLELCVVETPDQAEAERFLGSPTVGVNGVDVEPGAVERNDFGLKCRIYRSPEGQRAAPQERWLMDALVPPERRAQQT